MDVTEQLALSYYLPGLPKDSLEAELVQVAAVAICWLESLGFDRSFALALVSEERDSQDKKWGPQRQHSGGTWISILGEEFGEVCTAYLDRRDEDAEEDVANDLEST